MTEQASTSITPQNAPEKGVPGESSASSATPQRSGWSAVERRLVVLLVLSAFIVHVRVLGATFTGDDFRHFFESEALPFGRFLLRSNGDQFMAVHNVLFVLFHETVRLHATPYYALELVTHLVNVVLFFRLLRRLDCSFELAGVLAFLWGTAPIHQGTMRWFSVYQALLATSTTLIALLQLARAIQERRTMKPVELLTTSVALLAGAATVGGGTAVALLFPAVAWLTLPSSAAPARTAAILAPVALVGFIVPRLLTGTAAPMPSMILPMLATLVAYGTGALVAGPVVTVTQSGVGLLGKLPFEVPIAVGAVIAFILLVAVAVAFARGDSKERRFIVGMFLLAGAQYGAVAVARSYWALTHSVSWMATRDRYHYSQSLLLSLGVAMALRRLVPASKGSKTWPRAALVVAATLVPLDAMTALHGDAQGEDSSRAFMASLSTAIRAAARRSPVGAAVYLGNVDFSPVSIDVGMGMPRWQFPGIGGYWAIDHGTTPFEGRRIRFVEPSVQAVADLRANVEPDVAALFVTPEEAEHARARVQSLPEMEAMRQAWWNAQDPELREAVAESMRQDSTAAGQFRRALEQDPKAMEDFKRALQNDPAAMEALRREMARQAHPHE